MNNKLIMSEPLRATSNIIELKPDRKYLLVFSGEQVNDGLIRDLQHLLNEQRIGGVIIGLAKGQSLDVVEVSEQRVEAHDESR